MHVHCRFTVCNVALTSNHHRTNVSRPLRRLPPPQLTRDDETILYGSYVMCDLFTFSSDMRKYIKARFPWSRFLSVCGQLRQSARGQSLSMCAKYRVRIVGNPTIWRHCIGNVLHTRVCMADHITRICTGFLLNLNYCQHVIQQSNPPIYILFISAHIAHWV